MFRTILIVICSVVLPIGVYHRLRSQATGEALDRRQEGLFILFTLRPVAAVAMVGFLLYLINPSRMEWSSLPLPDWLRWIGVGLSAIGGVLLVWAFRSLGKNLTDTVVTRREHTLVMKGPYRWVRHPFYDAVGLFVLGAALAAANWFLLATDALFLMLIVIRTRTEEEKLVARFGDSYRSYMERTGRFLPKRRA